MKKKYFAPEIEEFENLEMVLLAGSGCDDEAKKDSDEACTGEDVTDM